ncbi:DUF2510 domain-containing protein [Agromyces sp. Marseille-Q5079]|uniref:DUF2510 domain-containing protein n=1 Tax=Agromyces sp. Marseille-Q5079 TaxID=3439059 RepID=UPI003D9CB9BE
MTERRAAGWYDDEADAAVLRYWNGASWTPHTTPRSVDEPSGPVAVAVVDAVADTGSAPTITSASVPGFASAPSFTSMPSSPTPPAFGSATQPAEFVSATLRMPPAATAPAAHVVTPSEHTTVPLPPNDAGTAASAPAGGPPAADVERSHRRRVLWTIAGVLIGFGLLVVVAAGIAIANLAASLFAVGGLR